MTTSRIGRGVHRVVCFGVLAGFAASEAGAQITTRVSVDTSGGQGNFPSEQPSISADGRLVAFVSGASNLVADDSNASPDVFLHDRSTGETKRISVSSAGVQGNGGSIAPSISADGLHVAFASQASNLVPNDWNDAWDIFVLDLQTGVLELESVRQSGSLSIYDSQYPSLSADGRYVAFQGGDDIVPGDMNNDADVFVRDRQTGQTECASVSLLGVPGRAALGNISADGRFVAFFSDASNIVPGDTNNRYDVFVRDRQSSSTTRVSEGPSDTEGNGHSILGFLAADARYVAFESLATNLVPDDTNGLSDIFVHDTQSGSVTRVSVGSSGAQGNGTSNRASISADGRFVAFHSAAFTLVANDTNFQPDVFVRDLLSNVTTRASVGSIGNQIQASGFGSISEEGRYVVFTSAAANVVAGDTNGWNDVFVHDRGREPAFAWCFGDETSVACPCSNTGLAGHGCENSAGTGGAHLVADGLSSLSTDTFSLTSSGELPSSLSIFLQGSGTVPTVTFGDGLRCVGGTLLRLYASNAAGGVVTAPLAGDPSFSERSASLGHPLMLGTTRHYQVYYRDADLGFCSSPAGNSWNVSNAISALWGS